MVIFMLDNSIAVCGLCACNNTCHRLGHYVDQVSMFFPFRIDTQKDLNQCLSVHLSKCDDYGEVICSPLEGDDCTDYCC
jgi:hypothetical protein